MRNNLLSQESTRRPFMKSRLPVPAVVFACVLTLIMALPANSCPFCSAVARTFTEQIDSSDLVVIACLESEPEGKDQTKLPRAMFRITNILKGEDIMSVGQEFKAVVVSRRIRIGDKFLVMGNGTDSINWTTPQLVSDTVIEYLKQLDGLPEKGADRLAFFVGYFEHQESMLAYDAYDEFARAPYADVKGLKDRIEPDQLLGWLKDPEVMKSRKRLYYTLLGVCGGEEQLPFLEEIIKSGDRDRQAGLDALIACYLTLRGDEGVPLIEETFLKNPEAEYIDVFSAISALRFHGTEADRVSRDRIVEALRYVLDRPKMADMVIPDLARWEDWSVMERLVQMFRDCDTDETRWVRTPIISYLQACPKEEARSHIAELREIDPNAAKRADMLAELDWGDEDDEEDEDTTEGDSEAGGQPQPSVEEEKASDGLVDIYDDGPVVTNPGPATYVSTIGEAPESSEPGDSGVDRDSRELSNEQLAQRTNPVPPAAMIVPTSPSTLVMLLASLGVCAILFLLLWSVLNGTFERLIS